MLKTVAEFFAGIGLVRLGLEQAGWQTVFANDIDSKKFEMYAHNFPDAGDIYRLCDIGSLSGEDVPTVTLATASFPCNDTSLAGRFKGLNGKHSSTVYQLFRLLDEMGERRPPFILLENVPSLLSSNGGDDFQVIIQSLNVLGYACNAFLVDAEQFTPQSRRRLFVLGSRFDENEYLRGHSLLQPDFLRTSKLRDFIQKHPDLRWSNQTTAALPSRHLSLSDIIENIPADSPLWWDDQREQYLFAQMSERHTAVANYLMTRSFYSYGTVFRRVRNGKSMAELRADGIAGCLRTPRGGSGRQILVKMGFGKFHARLLTPRECARLQGVPDSYVIDVPQNQALFGFGDAVCVPVIEWIASQMINPALETREREVV
jgi:DNA (cytosine-5)-methyltransferase 1